MTVRAHRREWKGAGAGYDTETVTPSPARN